MPSSAPQIPENRFWSNVDRRTENECWPWMGSMNGKGYGRFYVGAGKARPAHRIAYELLIGPIPEGLHLDHLCRTTTCVNPAHLEPVTPKENTLRGVGPTAVNATKTHCLRGHEFTPDNTYIRPNGSRMCRICHRKARTKDERRRRAQERAAGQAGA